MRNGRGLGRPLPFPCHGSAVVVVLRRVEDGRRGGRDARVGTRDQRGSAGTQGAAAPDEGGGGRGEAHEVRVTRSTGVWGCGGRRAGAAGVEWWGQRGS